MGGIYAKYVQENISHETKTPSKPILRLDDPRSASTGIIRTPIIIGQKIETPVTYLETPRTYLETPRTYLETDLDENNDNLTEIDVEQDENSVVSNATIPDLVEENIIVDEIQNINISDEVIKKEEASEELIYEIDWSIKRAPVSLEPQTLKSKRMPLGKICPNSPLSQLLPLTPKNRKQWRNIQDERKRRGLYDPENTPPLSAPPQEISSAPGKFMRHPMSIREQENY